MTEHLAAHCIQQIIKPMVNTSSYYIIGQAKDLKIVLSNLYEDSWKFLCNKKNKKKKQMT